ncbi:MAG: tRNA guanosine(34) transglycosylase Tgt [Candidatus Omnitrophica bacterium]|nr:tRNA guanosine(34) transglycosylase Tgt [Candidatus Omnitrophota bacterium]
MSAPRAFRWVHADDATSARCGILQTGHGTVETPAFMPVGTQGTVKTLTPEELRSLGASMILGNVYHLFIRPGINLIKRQGGLHTFMGWDGPILTDSGGYQVFSLARLQSLTDEGVYFNAHFDGRRLFLSPEDVARYQLDLGVDVAMLLDQCPPYPCSEAEAVRAVGRTLLWAERASLIIAKAKEEGRCPIFFGIVQGSMFPGLRKRCIERLVGLGFDGYAMGGLSVGEPKELMLEVLNATAHLLPKDRPRYLMGVGEPADIIQAVALGMDLFDCTLPTRLGRNGTAFTQTGRLVVRHAEYAEDNRPLDEACACYACRTFSRAYLRHLFNADEILGPRMLTLHNIHYYLEWMRTIREAIRQGRFSELLRSTLYAERSTKPARYEVNNA